MIRTLNNNQGDYVSVCAHLAHRKAVSSRQDHSMELFAVICYSAENINLVFWCSVTAIISHVSSIPFKMRINAPYAWLISSRLCAHISGALWDLSCSAKETQL